MANENIVSGNMSLGNTLFKKVYLLAGVVMAANMLVVNEIRATNTDGRNEIEINEFDQGNSDSPGKNTSLLKIVLNFVLTYENYINFIGGLVSSGFINNYFKWWDYNPGGYGQFLWSGWRSKRFLNDIFQFDINLNWVRCVFWMIATFFGSNDYLKSRISITDLKTYLKCTAAVIMASAITEGWKNGPRGKILFFFLSSLQGFVSMPLAIHISNFSIAISLDSIIWELVSGLSKIVMMKNISGKEMEETMTDDNKVNKYNPSYQNEKEDNEKNNEENNNYN